MTGEHPRETDAATSQNGTSNDSRGLWSATRRKPFVRGFVCLLLAAHAVLALDTARYCTVTHDEYWHIPVGLLNLTSGRFHFDDLNPPLSRMWAAAPLLASGANTIPAEYAREPLTYGNAFLAANPDGYHELVVTARVPIVVLSVLLCLTVGHWTTELFGLRAGVVALMLTALSPSIIASGALATTDLAAALMFVVSVRRTMKLSVQPNRCNAVLLGLSLGAAQLVKFTCLLLYAICPVVSLFLWRRNAASGKLGRWAFPGYWALAILVSLLVLDTGYLFRGFGTRWRDYQFKSRTMQALQEHTRPLADIPLPIPRDYLTGIDHQRQMMEGDHPVFLDGTWRETGFWHYYLKVLWYKLPHATQLLLLTALVAAMRRTTTRDVRMAQLSLFIPAAAIVLIAGSSKMQLGLRYILPGLPFLFILAAQGAGSVWAGRPRRSGLLVLALLLAIPFSVRFHPHHIAYFNELAGGPEGGWCKLVDSNIDWGQDLRALQQWLDRNPRPQFALAYFGSLPPGQLGLKYQLPPRHSPEPGWSAVSVNLVQGWPTPVRRADGSTELLGLDTFGYFRFFEPAARIGYSIHVYNLTEQDVIRLRIERRRLNNQR